MLRPSDLSLESVVSLADLPIPGFPKTSPEASDSSSPLGGGGDEKEADMEKGAGGDDTEEEKEEVTEFADTELGATVVECSSNSTSSGGLLQARERAGGRERGGIYVFCVASACFMVRVRFVLECC